MTRLFALPAGSPDYECFLNDESCLFQRDFLERCWKLYAPFAPNDFRKNLAGGTTGQIRALLWEMLLGALFIKNGYTLVRNGLPETDRPDLCIQMEGRRLWVECVMPRETSQPDPDEVIETDYGVFHTTNGGVEQFTTPDILSITNILGQKKDQHASWVKRKRIAPEDLYILAMNGHNLGFPIRSNQGFHTPFYSGFYPVGHTAIRMRPGRPSEVYYQRRGEVKKPSGAGVSQTAFLNAEYGFLSGLLYAEVLPPFLPYSQYHHPGIELVFINNIMTGFNPSSLVEPVATIFTAEKAGGNILFTESAQKTLLLRF